MVSDLRALRIVLIERVEANIARRCVLVFLLHLNAHSFYQSNSSELLEDCRFPLDDDVQELGQRILSDLHQRQLIVLTETRAENCCSGTHFVLLGVNCLICLATELIEDRHEIWIDDKRRYGTEFVADEFELRLFWSKGMEQIQQRHGIISVTPLFVHCEDFLRWKVTRASETKFMLMSVFCNVWE